MGREADGESEYANEVMMLLSRMPIRGHLWWPEHLQLRIRRRPQAADILLAQVKGVRIGANRRRDGSACARRADIG